MNGLVKPIFFNPLRHVYKLLTEPNYLSYNKLFSQLSHYKRYQECQAGINQIKLLIPDAASFLAAYDEIFCRQIYQFKANNNSPKILDLGANVGLSVIYFKQLYPEAEIVAVEADPKIFAYLENNIGLHKYTKVELINKAVWHENCLLHFASEGADAGQVNGNTHNQDTVEVEAIDVAELLSSQQFDLIKMDIEGAEEFVLPRCQGLLDSVQHFFIEYHSRVGHKQNLDRILSLLSQEGFRFYMENPCEQPTPFLGLNSYAGFDFQLNIYAWRETELI
ncbi:MAG: FkbM family methyltransferase [Cyanobacteria bacterium J06643_13]